jgi:hypothetical protein
MVEVCLGCGVVAEKSPHPWVGVTRDEDGNMNSWPVCDACFKDPAHRQTVLKMHFFPRNHAAIAVDAAERNILSDKVSNR